MTRLARPDLRLHETWAAAMLELGEEQAHGSGYWHLPQEQQRDLTRAGCAAYVAELTRTDARPAGEAPDEQWVPCDYYWILDDTDTDTDTGIGTGIGTAAGDPVVGFLALRHRLNAWLLEEGGHIGYSVRPSRRRQGHASRALALALERAAGLGLDRVLVTCDVDNEGSRRTIERNGGVLEDERRGRLRYWIQTPGPGVEEAHCGR